MKESNVLQIKEEPHSRDKENLPAILLRNFLVAKNNIRQENPQKVKVNMFSKKEVLLNASYNKKMQYK